MIDRELVAEIERAKHFLIESRVLLTEVSNFAPKFLSKLEDIFENLREAVKKRNYKNTRKYRAGLETAIKQITDAESVEIILCDEYNAAILPIYKRMFSEGIINFFKDLVDANLDLEKLPPQKLQELEKIKEKQKFKTLYIYIGIPLLKEFTSDELVAVILHELGHAYSRTSNMPPVLFNMIKRLIKLFSSTAFGASIVFNQVLQVVSLIIPFYFISMGGMSFSERLAEYNSDEYAVKYGYGDAMMSVAKKFIENREAYKNRKRTVFETFLYFLERLKEFATYLFRDHPDMDKRLEKIKIDMANKYKSIYPEYSRAIESAIFDNDKTPSKNSKE